MPPCTQQRLLHRVPPPELCHSGRKKYEALCHMYEKIQPLLENLHQNFTETQNNIGEQGG